MRSKHADRPDNREGRLFLVRLGRVTNSNTRFEMLRVRETSSINPFETRGYH